MLLRSTIDGTPIWHDCRTGFGDMLRRALADQPVIAALGPLYEKDPAESILAPFRRSMRETGWSLEEHLMAPGPVLARACDARTSNIDEMNLQVDSRLHDDLVDWARAGLVLEIARRHGIHVAGRGHIRPSWKLRGTITGRFGSEPVRGEDSSGRSWVFNPLSLGPDDRWRIRPSDSIREIAVLDFKGMDVCSMISIVPGLSSIYSGYPDPHQRTAELTGLSRDVAKQSFLTWAYGGVVEPYALDAFGKTFDSVSHFTRGMQHGDFPRMVQMTSALAFRAALSRTLPLLVGMHHIPMFVVHDELVLDVSPLGVETIKNVIDSLESGASDRVGTAYRVGVSTGYTYAEAKDAH